MVHGFRELCQGGNQERRELDAKARSEGFEVGWIEDESFRLLPKQLGARDRHFPAVE